LIAPLLVVAPRRHMFDREGSKVGELQQVRPVIRPATMADAGAIARIYNHYVAHTVITFEEHAVSAEEMAERIAENDAIARHELNAEVCIVVSDVADAGILALALPPRIATAQAEVVDGQVTKIDESAGKITIRHGPIKKFDMDDGMTMVYRAQDPAILNAVKPGDKVKFDADRVNGQFTITKIQKTK
jgi:Cu/Ag efflux protein CusF